MVMAKLKKKSAKSFKNLNSKPGNSLVSNNAVFKQNIDCEICYYLMIALNTTVWKMQNIDMFEVKEYQLFSCISSKI